MLIHMHPDNPDDKQIQQVVEVLNEGGIIIYPTDTVYGMGCDIYNQKAVEQVARIRKKVLSETNFSFICSDLSHLSDFTKQINNATFKIMKRNLPGPFTFILPANNSLPKLFKNKKKTVGIRVPDHKIPVEIVKKFGHPILTTSIHDEDEIIEYTTDPELIHAKYEHLVDLVISGGYGHNVPSTVVDCTTEDFIILRQGIGELIE